MTKRYYLIALLGICVASIQTTHIHAQTKVVTLLQGTITDESTGKPVQLEQRCRAQF